MVKWLEWKEPFKCTNDNHNLSLIATYYCKFWTVFMKFRTMNYTKDRRGEEILYRIYTPVPK